MRLNDSELATVLAALRILVKPLTDEDIAALSEKITTDAPQLVWLLIEQEPDNGEFPSIVLGTYGTKELAEAAKRAKQIEVYATEDNPEAIDPDGYDWHEEDKWWEIESSEVITK